jgi:hypothetical protein
MKRQDTLEMHHTITEPRSDRVTKRHLPFKAVPPNYGRHLNILQSWPRGLDPVAPRFCKRVVLLWMCGGVCWTRSPQACVKTRNLIAARAQLPNAAKQYRTGSLSDRVLHAALNFWLTVTQPEGCVWLNLPKLTRSLRLPVLYCPIKSSASQVQIRTLTRQAQLFTAETAP